ncbi:hypothetical protein CRG98_021298 [Punica granatum]|uniref:Secreted protein n=1 Tax=Punica granatum TaxID=22663 RepID=A0A2I0JPS4_PUNGR|nr:hypothetical protein CRG98_021298 [Punica granatum]
MLFRFLDVLAVLSQQALSPKEGTGRKWGSEECPVSSCQCDHGRRLQTRRAQMPVSRRRRRRRQFGTTAGFDSEGMDDQEDAVEKS